MDFINPYTITDIPLLELIRNLGIGIIIAVIWAFVIAKSTRIVVDTRQYQPIFLMLIPAMILIITFIKSSIALSLGLVGALSIVRFRTPIKEPEELLYLFIAIMIGLGLGANQVVATVIGFAVIALLHIPYIFSNNREKRSNSSFIDILIYHDDQPTVSVEDITNIFNNKNIKYRIKQIFETSEQTQIMMIVETIDMDHIESIKQQVRSLNEKFELSITDNARIIT